jgi:hypothetical protein
MKSTLEIIAEGLAARNVPVLLIGGMALPAFDVVRQTMDVDCLMVDTEEGALGAILAEAGYEEQERTATFVRYSTPSLYHMDVDVMMVDRGTFEKILAQSQMLDVAYTKMRVPCAAHLIALKLHAMKNNPKREMKEMGDIVEILRNNPAAVRDDELHVVCVRYGPGGIYARLKEAL